MALDIHTISVPAGAYGFGANDRIRMGLGLGVANAAGGAAGTAVAVVVTGQKLPPAYSVFVNPGQDATWWITNKTANGFTINLAPRLAANTIAAGTIDWHLVA
jgi:hypothetical protein